MSKFRRDLPVKASKLRDYTLTMSNNEKVEVTNVNEVTTEDYDDDYSRSAQHVTLVSDTKVFSCKSSEVRYYWYTEKDV